MNRFVLLFSFILLSSFSCTVKQEKEAEQDAYFDLEGYFDKEASRLQSLDAVVEKTVAKNELKEQKKLKIKNWDTELELFKASDINKPAWKDSYITKETPQKIHHTASDPELRTQEIVITKDADGTIRHIFIFNKTSNGLYSSTEKLNYYPDSLYQIEKEQQVRVLGTNNFNVTGKIK